MIDWSRVRDLQDEIGAEDFAAVVEIFLEEVDATVTDLDRDRHACALEAQLHFLKGSALNLGFRHFSVLCQEGETAAARGNAHAIDIDRILESYRASRREFLARLSTTAPVAAAPPGHSDGDAGSCTHP